MTTNPYGGNFKTLSDICDEVGAEMVVYIEDDLTQMFTLFEPKDNPLGHEQNESQQKMKT